MTFFGGQGSHLVDPGMSTIMDINYIDMCEPIGMTTAHVFNDIRAVERMEEVVDVSLQASLLLSHAHAKKEPWLLWGKQKKNGRRTGQV
jgi:hypothetical protein